MKAAEVKGKQVKMSAGTLKAGGIRSGVGGVVKNRRLKMSPGGLVTLPVAARKALAMKKGEGARVSLAVERGEILVTTKAGPGSRRISAHGMMELSPEARQLISDRPTRYYWLKIDDRKRQVRMVPYS